jgi:hypothetical protein
MKTLLLMRHAKSSWGDPKMPDQDRPLNKRGKRDAPRMGRLIREEGLLPDIILTSTALRARMTAEAIIDQSAYQGETLYLDELYMAEPEAYLNALHGLAEECDCALVIWQTTSDAYRSIGVSCPSHPVVAGFERRNQRQNCLSLATARATLNDSTWYLFLDINSTGCLHLRSGPLAVSLPLG